VLLSAGFDHLTFAARGVPATRPGESRHASLRRISLDIPMAEALATLSRIQGAEFKTTCPE